MLTLTTPLCLHEHCSHTHTVQRSSHCLDWWRFKLIENVIRWSDSESNCFLADITIRNSAATSDDHSAGLCSTLKQYWLALCMTQKVLNKVKQRKKKKKEQTIRQLRASPILACQWRVLEKRGRVKSDHYVSRILLCAHTAANPSAWLRRVSFKTSSSCCFSCFVLVYTRPSAVVVSAGQDYVAIKGGDGNSFTGHSWKWRVVIGWGADGIFLQVRCFHWISIQ